MGEAATALRGMMDTARKNAATVRFTFEEAVAVFDGEVDDEEEAWAVEAVEVEYEAEEDEEQEIPH